VETFIQWLIDRRDGAPNFELRKFRIRRGALDVNVTDYQRIPTIDPMFIEDKLRKEGTYTDFLRLVDEILSMKPRNIDSEINNEVRMEIETRLLSLLGFKRRDIEGLYHELITLVNLRAERAGSVE